MDQGGGSRNFVGVLDICSQAKQRATMKWLLSKAYNSRIPENFIEPFYKDHDNQEHLKPSLVHLLANAEIYCLALGNIYSDPNYHNINHCNILQILNKKGIIVNDSSVTETILIQTTPLKIAAHITIIEAIMTLFFKEVTTPNKIVDAIQRFNLVPNKSNIVMPENNERAILLWVNNTIEALKNRLLSSKMENSSVFNIAFVNDFSELSDGVAIAALIYFYCPNELPWQYVTVSNTPTSSDCIQNFSVINDFCDRSLPFKIFHMRPQDVYYIRGPMKINLIAFFADLFNALEINPVKCVSFNHGVRNLNEESPRNIHGVSYKRFLPEKNSIIPQLRSNLDSDTTVFTGMNNTHNNSAKKNLNKTNQKLSDEKNINRNSDDQFVVHHNRSVLTLNSMLNGCNVDNQNIAAGKPTHHEKKQSYAGRRSRKNSFSDESQLTVENFGGSQDNLHFLGRNPDKQPAIHIGHNSVNRIVNSHSQDNDSSGVQNLLQDTNTSPNMSRGFIDTSNNSQGLQRMLYDSFDEFETTPTMKRSLSFVDTTQHITDKTTWFEQNSSINNDNNDTEVDGSVTSSQLLNIKLKLEEKRRQIENDKRKMESLMNRQRQAVGKAAFLQAVSKSKNDNRNSQSPDLNYSNTMYSANSSPTSVKNTQSFSLQNNGIHNKWSDRMNSFTDDGNIPGYLNDKKYNTISKMHSNYKEMQVDLQYLNSQQKEIQHNSLQSEIQQDYHNSHTIQKPNYLINFHQNNCISPNEQIMQHSIVNYEQNQQSLPVLNNYDHTTFQEPYINQINSNSNSPINNYYLQGYSDQTMQSNMEKQSQQFFLHSQNDQNYKKSLDIPSSQTHTFDKNSQNVWNYGRTITQSPTHLLQRHKSECKSESISPIPPRRNYNNHIVSHSQMPTLSIDDTQLHRTSIVNDTKTSELNLSENLNRIQITSGHRTYRIPSPTRTHRPIQNSFSDYNTSISNISQDTTDNISDKGFYVSFEDKETPKRPKPPLRKKKIISKERNLTQVLNNSVSLNNLDISPNSTLINHVKTKEISTSINHATETTVLPISINNTNHSKHSTTSGVELIIENIKPDPVILNEMEKKKEKIILLSLKRRQNQEELKNKKELEIQKKKDELRIKEEIKKRKKNEEKERRAMILEQYRLKKMIEEAEKDGKTINKELLNSLKENNCTIGQPKLRNKIQSGRPRPKTIHVDCSDTAHGTLSSSKRNKALNSQIRRDYYRGSQDCLTETRRTSTSSIYSDGGTDEEKFKHKHLDGTNKNYRAFLDNFTDSSLDKSKHKTNFGYYTNQPRKSSSLMNLYGISNCDQYSLLYQYGDTDSGLGRATPPRRAASPCGPGSLPIRRKFDDAVSESGSDYTGPKLYKQPVIKSNRGIILNAVEYCVFPGVVNRENKKRVLDEINRSGARHFLILFRDTGCQFRALYLYYPETEEVVKLYGTGPRIVNDCMFDRFFKYNSGGKCFSQVHTRHLTVTIDAFTIHNSLWQGKKVNYPNKKDMKLVV